MQDFNESFEKFQKSKLLVEDVEKHLGFDFDQPNTKAFIYEFQGLGGFYIIKNKENAYMPYLLVIENEEYQSNSLNGLELILFHYVIDYSCEIKLQFSVKAGG